MYLCNDSARSHVSVVAHSGRIFFFEQKVQRRPKQSLGKSHFGVLEAILQGIQ